MYPDTIYIRGTEVSGQDTKGVDIGAIGVIETGGIDQVDPSSILRELEDIYGAGAWATVRRLRSLSTPRIILHEFNPWPMVASLPVHREMKVLLPEPVLPRTRMKTSLGSGLVRPRKTEKRWNLSASVPASTSVSSMADWKLSWLRQHGEGERRWKMRSGPRDVSIRSESFCEGKGPSVMRRNEWIREMGKAGSIGRTTGKTRHHAKDYMKTNV